MGWLKEAEFWAKHDYDDFIAAHFDELAEKSERLILRKTLWRAQEASTGAEVSVLAACQAALIVELANQTRHGEQSAMLSSANTDGYSESYFSAADQRRERDKRTDDILRLYFGDPLVGWMLYRGGVAHRRGR